MAILFDSGPRPGPHHDERLADVLARVGTPITVSHHDAKPSRTRIEHWRVGAHDLFRAQGDGLVLSRSAAQVRSAAPEAIRLGYQQCGRYTLRSGDHAEQGGHGRITIADQTRPCVFTQSGTNAAVISFEISFAQLEIAPDVIRRARPRLLSSPVFSLLHGHMARLCDGVEQVELADAGSPVGSATVLLLRAVIATVGGTGDDGRKAVQESLYQRVVEYAVAHLRDHDLSPERIAAVHNISLRHLYRIWAHNDIGVAEWLIRERLAGAARDLRDTAQRDVSVAAIARNWGFRDPAHFSHRFRGAYSVSPRSWRHDNRASAT